MMADDDDEFLSEVAEAVERQLNHQQQLGWCFGCHRAWTLCFCTESLRESTQCANGCTQKVLHRQPTSSGSLHSLAE